MAFMQPQVYRGGYFAIETDNGTEIVPDDVCNRTCSTHVSALLIYLEGKPLDPDGQALWQEGWLARLSAPGYLDCTDWTAHETEEEAKEYLREQYCDDADEEEEDKG